MGIGDVFKSSVERGRANAEAGLTPTWLGVVALFVLGLVWALALFLLYAGNYWAVPVTGFAGLWSWTTLRQHRKNRR